MPTTAIHDASDARLVSFAGLTDAEHRRALEGATGTFVIEGAFALQRALASLYPVRSVLLTPSHHDRLAPELPPEVDVFVADEPVLADVVGFPFHRGVLAVGERRALLPPLEVLAPARTLAVLEGVNDHENLGAIARSARALAVDGLLLDATCCDPLYRRSIRVSMGEVLHLPYARLDPWPDGLSEVRDAGFTLLALTPDERADDLDRVASTLPEKVALMLGAEGPGLSDAALAIADHRLRIPMAPGSDSLNIAHAAAIAFHVVRRRDARSVQNRVGPGNRSHASSVPS